MPTAKKVFYMQKCPRVKNPCKICLGPVSQKNGLQCCGVCESWVHYTCLNYTPGRIKDIKAGIIQVTCPCPDCKTSVPKERRTDEPFSCTNLQCPANLPPKCENTSCPTNIPPGMMRAGLDMMKQSCPLSQCGKSDCKQHSSPNIPGMLPTGPKQPCSPHHQPYGISVGSGSSSDSCVRCPTGCVSKFPGDMSMEMSSGSVGPGLPSLVAMEQMCNTVGLLSKQIQDLMMKMQQSTGGTQQCTTKGPRSLCPKPCYCPDNPKKC